MDWILHDAKLRTRRKVLLTHDRAPAVELTLTDRAARTDTAPRELSRAVPPIRLPAKCARQSDL